MDRVKLFEFLNEVDKEFNTPLSQKTDLSVFCDKLLEKAKLFVSYSNSGEIVGLLGLYANDYVKKYAYVTILVVSPGYRKQGIARKLMNDAIDYVKQLGKDKIQVLGLYTDNLVAFKLYQQLGFRLVDENGNRKYLELIL